MNFFKTGIKIFKAMFFPKFYIKNNIKFYKKTHYQGHKTSEIILNKGCLTINKPWADSDPFPSLLVLKKNATIRVAGCIDIYSGAKIYVNENANLILGSGYINHNFNLSCYEKIEIGENVVISENVCIRDSDNHSINKNNQTKPIKIGDRVWIGMNVTILKGVTIGNGAVIAAGSVVNKNIPANSLAAGVSGRVIKENITWD